MRVGWEGNSGNKEHVGEDPRKEAQAGEEGQQGHSSQR